MGKILLFKSLQMLFLVVALLYKTAFAEKEVYNITTAKRYGGLYVQIDESGKIFQQLDGANNHWGYFTYLYSLSEGSWNIGSKNEEGKFTGHYNAATTTSGNNGPPVEGWKGKRNDKGAAPFCQHATMVDRHVRALKGPTEISSDKSSQSKGNIHDNGNA